MLYSCTHMAIVGVKGLMACLNTIKEIIRSRALIVTGLVLADVWHACGRRCSGVQ